MALHHPGATLLALSILLLGILGFLQASDTPIIPLDQLTVEQAYLEAYMIQEQLRRENPPSITAEQRAILDRMSNVTLYRFHKPLDLLSNSSLHQQMTNFRQAFTNWNQSIKPGTSDYQFNRFSPLYRLYKSMVEAVGESLKKKATVHHDDQEAWIRGRRELEKLKEALDELEFQVNYNILHSIDGPEVPIRMTRDAVMAMPKFDENGQLISGSSWVLTTPSTAKPSNKLSHLKQPYTWGSALVLALGAAGYYFLKRSPVSSSGDLSSMFPSKIPFDSTLVAFERSSHGLWYILLLVGLVVALIALGIYWWWFCFKSHGATPDDEAKAAGKRTSKTKSQQLPATAGTSPSTAAETASARS